MGDRFSHPNRVRSAFDEWRALASLAMLFLMLFSPWKTAYAQDRMPAIPADKMTEAQKKAVAEIAPQERPTYRLSPRPAPVSASHR